MFAIYLNPGGVLVDSFTYLVHACSNRVQEFKNIKLVQLYMWKIYKVPVCRKQLHALELKWLRERLHESDAF